ncbi:orotidine-5'-phosphate decarboxylase [Candidatus Parcubacteria bacterium]|nr:orotidine-5'-phosphate decarboxylase [Candidatus Parcubacteria bacterium]
MVRILTSPERLIVAADFKPPRPEAGANWVGSQVLRLADTLAGTDVCIKINSALRACGHDLLEELHSRGLRTFADYKLNDIPETMRTDAELLQPCAPSLLTTMCGSGPAGMRAVCEVLPQTDVLGVTMLTSLSEDDSLSLFGRGLREMVMKLALNAAAAGVAGLVASSAEAAFLKEGFGGKFSIVTPGIRPKWAEVEGDDQNPLRVKTPLEAIRAGADRIVVGRPIIQDKYPRDAVKRTLEEIESAVR